MQSGLPADAASQRETGSVDRYTPRGPVSHRIVYIASFGAVSCLINTLADGAEGCTLTSTRAHKSTSRMRGHMLQHGGACSQPLAWSLMMAVSNNN